MDEENTNVKAGTTGTDKTNGTSDLPKEDVATHDKKRLKEVLVDIAMSTSVHGIANIVSATKTYTRLLWLILLLLAMVGYVFQLSQIHNTFSTAQKSTTMDIRFGVQDFPGVTFCNLNPIKKSALEETSVAMRHSLTASDTYLRESANPAEYELEPSFLVFLENFKKHGFNAEEWDMGIHLPTDPYYVRDVQIKSEMRKMNRSMIERTGHNIEDILLHCAFNGIICNSSLFTPISSNRYGNCYTLKTEELVTTVPGSPYGLSLILDLETYEYVSPSSSGNGMKLVIHEPGSYPFVEEHGVNVGPGRTSIGLNRIEIQRLTPPDGNCEYNNNYVDRYGMEYSKMACEQICQIGLTEDICGCLPTISSIDPSNIISNSRFCGEDENDFLCEVVVREAQMEGRVYCSCTNPCMENVYTKTISSHSWPRQEYLIHQIIPLICEDTERAQKVINITGYTCDDFVLRDDLPEEAVRPFEDNFVKLEVYFEDVNYEHIEEVDAYDVYQYLSDIGGATGLFVGASVLSLVEVVQIIVEVIKYAVNRLTKQKVVPISQEAGEVSLSPNKCKNTDIDIDRD
ncbi:FMRFamide-activated amiloride-sensitive sodium channel-like [Argopecten irradians]|uniref:FMRFamide-activated amiloride-sensitive sodium channel-like n=1 Tax=Argopecten irradians TaxID=31199 RepID=UPI00371E1BD8